jgi:glucan biosynthesis protein
VSLQGYDRPDRDVPAVNLSTTTVRIVPEGNLAAATIDEIRASAFDVVDRRAVEWAATQRARFPDRAEVADRIIAWWQREEPTNDPYELHLREETVWKLASDSDEADDPIFDRIRQTLDSIDATGQGRHLLRRATVGARRIVAEGRAEYVEPIVRSYVLLRRFAAEVALYAEMSTSDRITRREVAAMARLVRTYDEIAEIERVVFAPSAFFSDSDTIRSFVDEVRVEIQTINGLLAEQERAERIQHRAETRPAATQSETHVCSNCERRPRHFDDLCKRCANELGRRPTGPVR